MVRALVTGKLNNIFFAASLILYSYIHDYYLDECIDIAYCRNKVGDEGLQLVIYKVRKYLEILHIGGLNRFPYPDNLS